MKEIFEEFAEKIITKEDLIFFLEEMSLVQKEIFKNISAPLSKRIKEKVSWEIQELEKKEIISKNPEKNRIFFDNLKKYLQGLPQIKIEVAFQPSKEFVKKISLWLKKESGQKIVLDLIFNPGAVGGAIIEYQGKRLDFSLARKIDEMGVIVNS